jgi:palmitoyltransferase
MHSKYLGPSPWQIVHLLVLLVVNTLTVFLVSITFLRTLYGLGTNVTTIESWEIERHEQLLRRAKVLGGYLDGPDGSKIKIVRQEFPYDIGIWSNICAGMGSANPFAWFSPWAATPDTDGLSFPTNGFESAGTSWPPPDPDRMARFEPLKASREAFVHDHERLTPDQELLAFRQRQQADFEQRSNFYGVQKRKTFHQRFDLDKREGESDDEYDDTARETDSGEEGWRDSDGNRLKDYGVDEDVEFYDEDNVPVSELLRRRKNASK